MAKTKTTKATTKKTVVKNAKNKETTAAGTTLDVKYFSRKMNKYLNSGEFEFQMQKEFDEGDKKRKQYVTEHEVTRKVDGEEVTQTERVKCIVTLQSAAAMTAAMERFVVHLLNHCNDTPVDPTGNRCIKSGSFRNSLISGKDEDLRRICFNFINDFNRQEVTESALPFSTADLDELIHNHGKNLMFDNHARRALCFVINRIYHPLMCMIGEMLVSDRRRRVNDRDVKLAINLFFKHSYRTEYLHEVMLEEARRASLATKNENEEHDDNDDHDDTDDADGESDDDEPKAKKPAKKKPAPKKGASTRKRATKDEEDDSDDDLSEDDEPKAKTKRPASKKPAAKKKVAKKVEVSDDSGDDTGDDSDNGEDSDADASDDEKPARRSASKKRNR